ncbi:Unannotated [Lentimonas sp. CC19]|nr:Unannotated [Lentimonas sp. CC19]CAA6693951.1 Unannotated [Lentimonas sp. CC10]CAA7072204.1 Unannotated [Lentimonas sp. CC11]
MYTRIRYTCLSHIRVRKQVYNLRKYVFIRLLKFAMIAAWTWGMFTCWSYIPHILWLTLNPYMYEIN